MDPISAVSAIVGVVGAIGQVSLAATAFMHNVRHARKEIISVKKELSSVKEILEILLEDFKDDSNPTLPGSVVEQIVGVSSSCSKVVNQIGDCIKRQGNLGVTWAVSGKDEIEKLKGDLEVHKSTLNVTLELFSIIILKEIKIDTEKILQDTSTLKDDTTQIQKDTAHILAEISRLKSQLNSAGNSPDSNEYMLKRYLNGLKTDTETIIDESEDQDLWPNDYENSEYDKSSVLAPVILTNTLGKEFPIPYNKCKTWTDITGFVNQSYAGATKNEDAEKVRQGMYNIIGPNGQVILQSLWEQLVEPGWNISMEMWEAKSIIGFKDTLGRKFSFPFHLCQAWSDMEQLIRQVYVKTLDEPQVKDGHYDIIDQHGNIIIPRDWEECIKPGLEFHMDMWPTLQKKGTSTNISPREASSGSKPSKKPHKNKGKHRN